MRDRKGATAVEFAIIAVPLMMLIFMCLEMALYVLVTVSLDNATQKAARNIRMGIVTASNTSATQFRQQVCNNLGWLGSDCMDNLSLDVDAYDNFSFVTLTDPVNNGQLVAADMGWDVGGASKIQLVRTYLTWDMVIPFIHNSATMANGKVLISSKVVFRNEPF
jgi:Flp pilus assembly protein TadG